MIKIIAVGKIKEKALKELILEYQKRINGYEKIEIIEVKEEIANQNNSFKDNERIKMIESNRILEKIKNDDYVILLSLKGKMLDSIELSNKLEQIRTYHSSNMVFVIGGSLGTSNILSERSNFELKLSDLTFPHQIARLLVLEQLYRAFKIKYNEPYHK